MTTRLAIALVLLASTSCAVAQLPEGFMSFFDAEKCPDGWAEVGDYQGRLLVSVSDASKAGVTVGDPLGDREDRTHTHGFKGTVEFPEKDVAAIGCCNDQAAQHGTYDFGGTSKASPSGLPFLQLLLCRLSANSSSLFVPYSTLAFFDTNTQACPTNWTTVDQTNGRVLVPSFAAEGMFQSPAPALASGEDRQHNHTLTTTLNTTDVSFAGVEGCCNKGPSKAGELAAAGGTAPASLGIPYVQTLTCVYTGESFSSSLPKEILLFNTVLCDQGWQPAVGMSGRVPVALPSGGSPGATFGGDSFPSHAAGEANHTHGFTATVSPSSAGVGLDSGCCGHGYAGHVQYPIAGATSTAVDEFPYTMAPLCVQL